MGLPPPEPLEEGAPDLHYFLLSDNALMLWLMKLRRTQQKKTHKGRMYCHLHNLQSQEGGGKYLRRSQGHQRYCLYMCGFAQHDKH